MTDLSNNIDPTAAIEPGNEEYNALSEAISESVTMLIEKLMGMTFFNIYHLIAYFYPVFRIVDIKFFIDLTVSVIFRHNIKIFKQNEYE